MQNDDKKYDNANEILEDINRDFKERHPIEYWIDRSLFRGKGLLGYAPHHTLTHPWLVIEDAIRETKWAYQRVFRGWDDKTTWSIDYWLNHIMPDILKQLRENKIGIPIVFFDGMEEHTDEKGILGYTKEQEKIAEELWNKEINKMIAGFTAGRLINDWRYDLDGEYKYLEETFKKGMASFVEHYFSLWD